MVKHAATHAETAFSSSAAVKRIRLFAWIMCLSWTAILAGSAAWYHQSEYREIEGIARAEARAAFNRDLLFRRWATSHGGVYAPVSNKTLPNPYLAHIPERDITTPSGRQLTLINPAYMMRQIYESTRTTENVGRGHITSLKPLRAENAPDPWETEALRSFERGISEAFEIHDIDGSPHMRLMRPFVTEKACLKCHAAQGYREGEIRGGISVSIPMQPLLDSAHNQLKSNVLIHGILWIAGVGMITFGSRKLSLSTRTLHDSEERYRTVAEFTSDWEYWMAPDRTFRYVSPSCRDICGYTSEEFYSDPELLHRIIHPNDRELFKDHHHFLQKSGDPEPIDFRIITKDGQVRWIAHVCREVTSREGQPLGRRASNRDITVRKRAENELHLQAVELEEEVAERQQAQEQLQEQAAILEEEIADRQQAQEQLAIKQLQLEQFNLSLESRIDEAISELRRRDQLLIQQGRLAAMGEMIHNIAHQWRQPLNNVGLIIQNLQLAFAEGNIDKNEFEHEVKNAMNLIMHMSRTIDDFRNFFRTDKEKHAFIVNNAVKHAVDFVSASLQSNNINVELTADEEVTTVGYPNEYAQVLLNLLDNARDALIASGTADKYVRVNVTSENGRSVVTVRDNGGGIPENILPKIFDPYFSTKAQGKGSGIGLYLSKTIIEQNMEGHLTARNIDGGAEFRIEV